jgi:adenylosuccinate lyase
MHERYIDKEMAEIWSDENKFKIWFDIERYVCEINAKLKHIPDSVSKTMLMKKDECFHENFISEINDIESVTKHDIIAFLTHLSNVIGDDAKYIHYGMTSQDLIDTGLAIQLRNSIKLIIDKLKSLKQSFKKQALEHKNTYCVGRSHGIHAEPMTFGLKLLSHFAAFDRCEKQLSENLNNFLRIKCSGAVGTFSMIEPTVEETLSNKIEIYTEDISTQVIPRDRIALLISHLSITASCIERFAVEIRHLQRTEVGEVIESFTAGQKGSSAMPHKKNPILTENLTGLCRAIRMAIIPALENIALWHERDISHSSAERIILPDTFVHLAFALNRTKQVVDNMNVDKNRMLKNLQSSDMVYSQQVLLYLIKEKGYSREDAYKIVQESAHSGGDYFKISFKDRKILSLDEINEIFNPKNYMKNVDYIYNKVLK